METNSLIHVAAFVEANDGTAIHIASIVSTSLDWSVLVKYHLLSA